MPASRLLALAYLVLAPGFTAPGIDTSETEYDNGGQPVPLAHEDCRPVEEILT
jgi:hypothetical protein